MWANRWPWAPGGPSRKVPECQTATFSQLSYPIHLWHSLALGVSHTTLGDSWGKKSCLHQLLPHLGKSLSLSSHLPSWADSQGYWRPTEDLPWCALPRAHLNKYSCEFTQILWAGVHGMWIPVHKIVLLQTLWRKIGGWRRNLPFP